MKKHIKKLMLILLPTYILSGCGTIPQNPDEFVQQVSKSPIGVTNEKETIKVQYASARRVMKNTVIPCLTGRVRTTTTFNNGARTVVDRNWTPKFVDMSKTRSRMTLQIKSDNDVVIGGGKLPKDGGYVAVIDLEKKTASTTQVSYHIVNTFGVKGDVHQPTRDFLNSKKGACKFK